MTSPSDDDREETDEGIRIEFPFVSFRMGRFGRGGFYASVERDEAYERARRRVRARLGLYRHVATYFAVMAAVIFIDLVTGGGVSDFVLWVAGIWGALLVWQGFNVFVFPAVWSRETEERMIEDEMRRQQDGR